jgi:hypothetical protein
MRKFEYREAYEPPAAGLSAKKGLDFSVSDDNSGNLGMPAARTKNRPVFRGSVVPEEVGARDGFESTEKKGDKSTDRDLAVMLQALRMQYPRESLTEIRERCWNHLDALANSEKVNKPAIEDLSQSGKDKAIFVQPIAMLKPQFNQGSSDMIPVLRGLSSWVPSDSSTCSSMADVSSILGKRFASCTEEEADSKPGDRAIVLHTGVENGNFQKKGRIGASAQGADSTVPMEGVEFLEAISHGAADKLTGSHGAPRQEQ